MNAETEKPKYPGRIRHCWNCGAEMGFIEDRYYERIDVCGEIECNRAQRDAYAEERQAAHDRVDDYYDGW